MTVKYEMVDFSISPVRASIVDLHATVNIWNAADDTMSDPPAKTEAVTLANVKSYVEGKTPQELADRWHNDMRDKIQSVIGDYDREQGKIDDVAPTWASSFNTIDGEIVQEAKEMKT